MSNKNFEDWNMRKINIEKSRRYFNFDQREIWWCAIGENIGEEICGKNNNFERPVLILKKYSKESAFVLPLASKIKSGSNFFNINSKDKERCILLHQGRFVSRKRLLRRMETVSENKFDLIKANFELLYKIEFPPYGGNSQAPYGEDIISISNSTTKSSDNVAEPAKRSSNRKFYFDIIKKSKEATLARAGVIHTPHGDIETPAFITVGTKATVKALTTEQIRDQVGAQAVLANTYHLYLQPGSDIVARHGGFAKMMGWSGPSMTDSGGFQVFSLGQAMGRGVTKVATSAQMALEASRESQEKDVSLVKITEDGVEFKSIHDGSKHFFSPEKSMQIQHDLGADIFFAFDECTSPLAPYEYQIEALERTSRWAERSLSEHKRLGISNVTGEIQALYGVVQGGAYADLRERSARELGAMDFDGYGIGGSFTKEDMGLTVKCATENLPEEKPRHLLGIGEPIDFFVGVEYGIDTFDCVTATRVARNGAIYTRDGRINITNAKYKTDMNSVCEDKSCYTHAYTKAYLHHLFKSEEILAATIASIHNLHFITHLVMNIRKSILENRFFEFKSEFCDRYYKNLAKI